MARLAVLLVLLWAVVAEGSHASTCALCARGGDCSSASLGKPGRYCGAYNTTYDTQELCCCGENDVCGIPYVDGQCECTTIEVDPTLRNQWLLRAAPECFAVDALIFFCIMLGYIVFAMSLLTGLPWIYKACQTAMMARGEQSEAVATSTTSTTDDDGNATETSTSKLNGHVV